MMGTYERGVVQEGLSEVAALKLDLWDEKQPHS